MKQKAKLNYLKNNSYWATNENAQNGRWFNDSMSNVPEVSQVFLPASGCRKTQNGFSGVNMSRNGYGYYWSSTSSRQYAYYLDITKSSTTFYTVERANGYSVRCVQE